jgi:hypothetical protein
MFWVCADNVKRVELRLQRGGTHFQYVMKVCNCDLNFNYNLISIINIIFSIGLRDFRDTPYNTSLFFWSWGGSSTQTWMPTYVSILRIPQLIWVWRATVEFIYWQVKPQEFGEKPVPVPLCLPQIPHGLTRARTRASAVRGQRLTTWAMARPYY